MRKRSEDPYINVLRGMAILMVIALHAIALTPNAGPPGLLEPLIARLSNGVQLFFVLSGYLVSASFARSIERPEGVRGYLLHRAMKIVPLYLIFLALNVALVFLDQALFPATPTIRNSAATGNVTPGNILIHLFFLQGLFPGELHTLVDGSWSIVCEVYFYLLLPVIWPLTRSTRGLAWMFGATLAIGGIFVILTSRTEGSFSYYGFPAQAPCFVLGIFAYRISQNEALQAAINRAALPILLCATIAFLSMVRLETKPLPPTVPPALCFAVMLLSIAPALRQVPVLLLAPIGALGKRTYALYFLHLVVLKQLLVATGGLGLGLGLAENLAIALAGSFALSWLLFDHIDRYFVGLGHRLARHLPIKAPGSPPAAEA